MGVPSPVGFLAICPWVKELELSNGQKARRLGVLAIFRKSPGADPMICLPEVSREIQHPRARTVFPKNMLFGMLFAWCYEQANEQKGGASVTSPTTFNS